MTTLTETTHPGGFLVWEAFRDYTRETVTVAAGNLDPGTVLGRITASGKYAAHDPAATDGTETAVAVLWGKADASAGDVAAVASHLGVERPVGDVLGSGVAEQRGDELGDARGVGRNRARTREDGGQHGEGVGPQLGRHGPLT